VALRLKVALGAMAVERPAPMVAIQPSLAVVMVEAAQAVRVGLRVVSPVHWALEVQAQALIRKAAVVAEADTTEAAEAVLKVVEAAVEVEAVHRSRSWAR
jgi:hypothetical protein